jgi:GldM N-terminal domain
MLYNAIDSTLWNANTILRSSSSGFVEELSQKGYDPPTSVKGVIWHAKAMKIDSITGIAQAYINNQKETLRKEAGKKGSGAALSNDEGLVQAHFVRNGSGYSLFRHLVDANEALRGIDSNLNEAFSPVLMANFLNIRALDSVSFLKEHFQEATPWQVLVFLAKLQTDISILENRMVRFCNNKVSNNAFIIEDFETYSAIVGLTSNIVEGGRPIQIFAGLGNFSTKNLIAIKINKKAVSINEAGQAVDTLKAPMKPGLYKIPVEILYLDRNRKQQVISKQVEYKVVNELN